MGFRSLSFANGTFSDAGSCLRCPCSSRVRTQTHRSPFPAVLPSALTPGHVIGLQSYINPFLTGCIWPWDRYIYIYVALHAIQRQLYTQILGTHIPQRYTILILYVCTRMHIIYSFRCYMSIRRLFISSLACMQRSVRNAQWQTNWQVSDHPILQAWLQVRGFSLGLLIFSSYKSTRFSSAHFNL